MELFAIDWDSDYSPDSTGMMQNFFSVFSVYFPAGIGILAGANVSGDLRVTKSGSRTLRSILTTDISLFIRTQTAPFQRERFWPSSSRALLTPSWPSSAPERLNGWPMDALDIQTIRWSIPPALGRMRHTAPFTITRSAN